LEQAMPAGAQELAGTEQIPERQLPEQQLKLSEHD
jgi:hypothetical protein